jgi:hypothetical protein
LGPLLRLFKYFRQKNGEKIWRFCLKTKLYNAKFNHIIGFSEKRQFFRQIFRKLLKIVIITSTLGGGFLPEPWQSCPDQHLCRHPGAPG